MRKALPVFLAFLPFTLIAQGGEKAAACFWSNDFESGIPLDWEITQVERQTSAGVGLGEFVPSFTLGTATDANSGGYFPVPDRPIGNRFIMANDDASPCNCDMDTVSLTTGPIDLTGRTGLALEFRAFHEMTLGAGEAIVEASTNGSDWNLVDTLDPVAGAWQDLFLDLSAYDDAPLLKLRFRWSDGGQWSSGFALDDLCLRERFMTDVSIVGVRLGNDTASAFVTGDQRLGYSQVPLEQAAPAIISVEVVNRGTTVAPLVSAHAWLELNGTDLGDAPFPISPSLQPGERTTLVVETMFVPNSTGDLVASVVLIQPGNDDDPSDNTGSATMRITGPGWNEGYGAMAIDDDQIQGSIGSTEGFIAANRFEIVNEGSTAHGASAVLGYGSQIDEVVRAIIMDGNFAFIDTSLRHTIAQADLDGAAGGLPVYLPFANVPALDPGDYFVGLQRLAGTGYVSVATSGNCTLGQSVLMEGATFDIAWTDAIPMVRLHLNDYGVGVDEPGGRGHLGLRVSPNPATGPITLAWDQARSERVVVRVIDLFGRTCLQFDLGHRSTGPQRIEMDASELSSGTYTIGIATPSVTSCTRLIIAR
ncbi:MAG: hypothetical protein IPL52_17130 [Flavobacteriales bacterium]|nr:hypothetical protein [Flavobacteriales bacterium]